jgi:hypothetical protein
MVFMQPVVVNDAADRALPAEVQKAERRAPELQRWTDWTATMVAEDTKPPSEDTPRPEANEVTPAPGKTSTTDLPRVEPSSSTFPGAKEATTPRSEGGEQIP